MTAFDFLAGTSAYLALIGIAAMLLAFVTALMIGFRTHGALWIAILIAALTGLAVIGSGLVVASFSHTTSQAFLIANFPLGIFMFFSSAIYPLPRFPIFSLAVQAVSPFDILPPTHAVAALYKVLTLGSGLGEIAYELRENVGILIGAEGAEPARSLHLVARVHALPDALVQELLPRLAAPRRFVACTCRATTTASTRSTACARPARYG